MTAAAAAVVARSRSRVGRAESEDKPPAPRFARCCLPRGASCWRSCRERGHTPRFLADARRCPPRFGGLLGEEFSVEVRQGALMKLIADLEAPWRKTPTSNKPPAPRNGGQRRRRGGLVPAFCKTRNKKPPETGAATSEARRGGHPLALCTTDAGPPLMFCMTLARNPRRFLEIPQRSRQTFLQ